MSASCFSENVGRFSRRGGRLATEDAKDEKRERELFKVGVTFSCLCHQQLPHHFKGTYDDLRGNAHLFFFTVERNLNISNWTAK